MSHRSNRSVHAAIVTESLEPRQLFAALVGGQSAPILGTVAGSASTPYAFTLAKPGEGRLLKVSTGGKNRATLGGTYNGKTIATAAVDFATATGATLSVTVKQSGTPKPADFSHYTLYPYADYVGNSQTAATDLGRFTAGTRKTIADHVGTAAGGEDGDDWFKITFAQARTLRVDLRPSASAVKSGTASQFSTTGIGVIVKDAGGRQLSGSGYARGAGGTFDVSVPAGVAYVQLDRLRGDEPNYVLNLGPTPTTQDLSVTSAAWNATLGGVTVGYKIAKNLASKASLQLFWAKGATAGDVLTPIQTQDFLANTKATAAGTWNVVGNVLKNAPAGTTHLVAFFDRDDVVAETDDGASPAGANNLKALADVTLIGLPINAASTAIVKGLLRVVGDPSATVSSTYRTERRQAEIMYADIVGTPANDYAYSRNLYNSATGKPVIDVGIADVKAKKTAAQTIADMTARIVAIKGVTPGAFPHTQDPAKLQTFDIDAATIVNGTAFEAAIKAAGIRHFSPFTSPKDNAFHFEIPVA